MSRLRGVSFGVVGTAWRERQSYAFVPKWVHGTRVNFLLMDSAAKEKRQRERVPASWKLPQSDVKALGKLSKGGAHLWRTLSLKRLFVAIVSNSTSLNDSSQIGSVFNQPSNSPGFAICALLCPRARAVAMVQNLFAGGPAGDQNSVAEG